MLPSHWLRKVIILIAYLEIFAGIIWVFSGFLDDELFQLLAALILIFVYFAISPALTTILIPKQTANDQIKSRVARLVGSLHTSTPVFVYDNAIPGAYTVGFSPSSSKIYLTSSLVERLSDEGIRAVVAHENTHISEAHVLGIYTAICIMIVMSFVLPESFSIIGFLLFLFIRRYFEYRADAGSVRQVGESATITALEEVAEILPQRSVPRWLVFALSYPTILMRIDVIKTGKLYLL